MVSFIFFKMSKPSYFPLNLLNEYIFLKSTIFIIAERDINVIVFLVILMKNVKMLLKEQ